MVAVTSFILYSSLRLTKTSFFFFIYKIGEQEGGASLAWGWGLVQVGGGRRWGKDIGG
jgi:hypothetical protein